MISLLLFLSCTLPTNRETLELIALLDNGHVFETRFTKGDTGLYKGQGHLHINRWTKTGSPMSFHFDSPPIVTEFTPENIDFFGYRMYKENDTWQLYVRAEEYNVSGQIRPSDISPIQLQEENWNIDILQPHAQLVGWSSTFGRGGVLKGDAVLFHRHGTALLQGERTLLIAFDSHNHIGIEHSNVVNQSWGSWNSIDMRDEEISQTIHPHHIDFYIHDQKIQFIVEAIMGEEDLYKHLSTPERLLSSPILSTEPRTLLQGRITKEDGSTIPGVCFYHGNSAPLPSRKNK